MASSTTRTARDRLAPAERVEVDGVTLAVRRAGAGLPVLLLHGIPTSSRLWDGVGRELAGSFDLIAPDLLGFGDSDKPAERDVSITAQAALVPALPLDRLGVERAVVVGHDIGGGVAQIVAVRSPERVVALGLVDAVCFDSWPIAAMKALQRSAPVASRAPAGWLAGALERATAREVPPGDPLEALAAGFAAWSDDAGALLRNVVALDARHTLEIVPLLGAITAPTHIVWGAADPFQKPEWAPRLRDAIPGATLRMLDARHFVPWDSPAELAAEIRLLAERT